MQTTENKHILVVDDEANTAHLLARILENASYRVTIAANGEEALAIVRREAVDLALVDLFMPVKDGFETVQEIHQDAPQVKLIAISGWYPDSDSDLLAATLDLYVSHRLRKPIKSSELLAVVEQELTSP